MSESPRAHVLLVDDDGSLLHFDDVVLEIASGALIAFAPVPPMGVPLSRS